MYQAKKTYTIKEALVKLQKYCAYQDRCHKEVEQKLTQMRMIPKAIEQIIVDLIQNNYLNEERFAKAYVRGKFSIKKWGKVRLTLELKQRQISKYVIKTALAEIDPDALSSSTGFFLISKFFKLNFFFGFGGSSLP